MSTDSELDRLQPFGIWNILNLSQEQAAGGMCSLRVLQAINEVNRNVNTGSIPQTGQLCSFEGPKSEQEFHTFTNPTRSIGARGELVVLPASDDTVTRLGYYHRSSNNIIELWNLVEKKPDLDECSYAVFMPASDNNLDVDYSLVVTNDDEQSPLSLTESLKDVPLTNAETLEALLGCLRTGNGDRLEKLIKLDELMAAYGADQRSHSVANYAIGLHPEPVEPLARYMHRLAGWAALSHSKINMTKKFGQTDASFELHPDGIISLQTKHNNLGRTGRITDMGSLALRDDALLMGHSEIADQQMLTELLASIVEVPKVVTDEAL